MDVVRPKPDLELDTRMSFIDGFQCAKRMCLETVSKRARDSFAKRDFHKATILDEMMLELAMDVEIPGKS